MSASNQEIIHTEDVSVSDAGGVRLQFVAPPEVMGSDGFSIFRGVLWPGIAVPLHSHADLECFYILDGELEHYQESRGWRTAKPGDVVVIREDVKHAWRNGAQQKSAVLVFTTGKLCRWLQKLARPCDPAQPPAPPTHEYVQELLDLANTYHYWTGSPEENAAIGIKI